MRTVRDWRRYIADLTSDGVVDAIEVAYRGLKRKFHAVDFDDLVNEYLRFVKRRPGVASFKAYVRSGGFPGYFATNEKEVLRELVGDILCQHGRR